MIKSSNFLKEIYNLLKKDSSKFHLKTLVFPSKRAGLQFIKTIQKEITSPLLIPKIMSIEDFIEEYSGLESINPNELILEFYDIYKNIVPKKNLDTLEVFLNWAPTVIQDFNEIDRYLLPADEILNYLKNIQDLNHWSLDPNKSKIIENYLNFWDYLLPLYNSLNSYLLDTKKGTQGLQYRLAYENICTKKQKIATPIIFIGFNALNSAEEKIFQYILNNNLGSVYWDAEENFMSKKHHSASKFLNKYKNSWKYYKENTFSILSSEYCKSKNIYLTACPNTVSQVFRIRNIIDSKKNLGRTAIVLGDEMTLIPLIKNLNTKDSYNISMEFPVSQTKISALFKNIFELFLNGEKLNLSVGNFYYKDVLKLFIYKPLQEILFQEDYTTFLQLIEKQNNTLISAELILSLNIVKKEKLLNLLLPNSKIKPKIILKNLTEIISILQDKFQKDKNWKENTSIEFIKESVNELINLFESNIELQSIKILDYFFNQIISTKSNPFISNPDSSIQILGTLETRVIDYDTVIITNLNEGILPASSDTNSFIPFDLKIHYGLPTYHEKDTIYSYHFYHLIQRAKNIHLLYNEDNSGVETGEKSRFINQIEFLHHPNHKIHKNKISFPLKIEPKGLREIKKTEDIRNKIITILKKGLSPSSITNYIYNPINFYYEKIIGISDELNLEETIASNTMGTVIHNVLEHLYKPKINQILDIKFLDDSVKMVNELIEYEYLKVFTKKNIDQGKNKLIIEVSKRHVYNFLEKERKRIHEGEQIKIIGIEVPIETKLYSNKHDLYYKLIGKVDRIEEVNNVTRIIDYKSGKVLSSDLKILDWTSLLNDYKYSKVVQVLTYAYMYKKSNPNLSKIKGGIISFKNLKEGLLLFGEKEKARGKVNTDITDITLNKYIDFLNEFIDEILDINIPFKEVKR